MEPACVIVCLEQRGVTVPHLVHVVHDVLPSWTVYLVHRQGDEHYWSINVDNVTLVEASTTNYDDLLTTPSFWSQFPQDYVLVHGPDDVLCKKCPWKASYFMAHDFVCGSSSSTLSLRNRHALVKCLDDVPREAAENEQAYFARAMLKLGYSVKQDEPRFVSTSEFTTKSFGASNVTRQMNTETLARFVTYCPEVMMMMKINSRQENATTPQKLEKLSKILYGVPGRYKNITWIALSKCVSPTTKVLTIPTGDSNRCALFGDHLFGTLKHIVVDETIYTHRDPLCFDVSDLRGEFIYPVDLTNPIDHLEAIHSSLRFEGGNVRDEYPEQLMVVTHVRPDDVVLEIGSNIGRNTLTIATLLSDSRNLVTVECDPKTCVQLAHNRELNGMHFAIEPSALSKRKLIQRGWDTQLMVNDVVPHGYKAVSSLSVAEFKTKYPLDFSVLVADCEGALYYILQDEPQLLDGLRLVIMENDYKVIEHKRVVDGILLEGGFRRIHVESGGWGPCKDFFFEVWARQE